ncbi:MAG: hypothetical protein ACYDDF_11200 [Thermoplasmatota archaeon]
MPDECAKLLLQVLSHLKDVMGERASASLIQYAGSEAGVDIWRAGESCHAIDHAFEVLEDAIGARVVVVSSQPDSMVVNVPCGPRGATNGFVDQSTIDALVVGILQSAARHQTGRLPEIVIQPHERGDEESREGA